MSDSIFEQALAEVKPNWSAEDFTGLTLSEMRCLRKWIPGVSVLADHIKQRFRKNGVERWNAADIAVLDTVIETKETLGCARPRDYIVKGGVVEHTATEIVAKGRQQVVFANSAVPSAEPAKYSNLTLMSTVVSFFIKQKGGKFQSVHDTKNEKAVIELFGKTGLNYRGFARFGKFLTSMLSRDPEWNAMSDLAKSAVSGPALLIFCRGFLNRLTAKDYFCLNNKLAIDIFDWWLPGPKGLIKNPQRMESAFEWLSEDEISALGYDYDTFVPPDFLGVGFLKYTGKFSPKQLSVVTQSDSLQKCLTLTSLVRSAIGGKKSSSFIMSRAKGFSGMPDEFERKINFFVGSAVACWYKGEVPLINLDSLGDLAYIHTALEKAVSIIDKKLQENAKWLYKDDWQLRQAFPEKYRPFLGTGDASCRQIIWFGGSSITTKTKDLTEASLVVQGNAQRVEGKFVAYGFVVGATYFPDDESVQQAAALSLAKITPFARVYRLGSAAQFEAVFTDLDTKEWTMMGREVATIIPVPLVRIDTVRKWYTLVAGDLAEMVYYWQLAPKRYSPLANWVMVSMKTLESMAEILLSEDELVPSNDVVQTYHSILREEEEDVRPASRKPPTSTASSSPLSSSSESEKREQVAVVKESRPKRVGKERKVTKKPEYREKEKPKVEENVGFGDDLWNDGDSQNNND